MLKKLKLIFDFYINTSFHVAFAMACFIKITQVYFEINNQNSIICFSFFGTIFGYNFIKYSDFILENKKINFPIKLILALSIFCFGAASFFFFFIEKLAKFAALFFTICVFFYTFSCSKKYQNIRNWSGFKIYFVCFCWTSISVLLPLLNYKVILPLHFWMYFSQRFLVIFTLILLFEIGDLKKDLSNLKTIPQLIGVKKTKILGCLLLLVYLSLSFFKIKNNFNNDFNFQSFKLPLDYTINIVIALVITIFLYHSSQNRSKYFTLFWVESIPIVWLFLLLIFG